MPWKPCKRREKRGQVELRKRKIEKECSSKPAPGKVERRQSSRTWAPKCYGGGA